MITLQLIDIPSLMQLQLALTTAGKLIYRKVGKAVASKIMQFFIVSQSLHSSMYAKPPSQAHAALLAMDYIYNIPLHDEHEQYNFPIKMLRIWKSTLWFGTRVGNISPTRHFASQEKSEWHPFIMHRNF